MIPSSACLIILFVLYDSLLFSSAHMLKRQLNDSVDEYIKYRFTITV